MPPGRPREPPWRRKQRAISRGSSRLLRLERDVFQVPVTPSGGRPTPHPGSETDQFRNVQQRDVGERTSEFPLGAVHLLGTIGVSLCREPQLRGGLADGRPKGGATDAHTLDARVVPVSGMRSHPRGKGATRRVRPASRAFTAIRSAIWLVKASLGSYPSLSVGGVGIARANSRA